MSARRTILKIAENKGVSIQELTLMVGYKLPHHFIRALGTPESMAAKRVVKLSLALGEDRGYILTVLTNGRLS